MVGCIARCSIFFALALTLGAGAASADLQGQYLDSFGGFGAGQAQLSSPDGIATSDDGFIYLADTYNSRVQKFTLGGQWVASIGSNGSGPGQFMRPYGIDVDAGGNVYVGDLDRHDVQKFAADGTYLLTFAPGITQPFGLWADDAGTVYVTDRPASCVRTYGSGGALLGTIGPSIQGHVLVKPQNIEGNDQGQLYISDGDGALTVVVITTAGAFVRNIASPPAGPSNGNPTGGDFAAGQFYLTQYNIDRAVGIDGSDLVVDILGDNEPVSISSPLDCATSGDSLLLVLSTGDSRVHRFRLVAAGSQPHVTAEFLDAFGSVGAGPGQFGGPDGIAVSGDGHVYVADTYNSRVQKFTLDGAHVSSFGSFGSGDGQFSRPYGIAVDEDGNVYVSDLDRADVQKFASDGSYVSTFGGGTLGQPFGLWVGGGVVYVTDRPNRRIARFGMDGTSMGFWGPTIGPLELAAPQNIEGDGLGGLYVSDGFPEARVHLITESGVFGRTMPIPLPGNPTGAAVALQTLIQTQYDADRVLGLDVVTNALSFVLTSANGRPFDSPIDCASYHDSLLFVLDTGVCRVLRYQLTSPAAPRVNTIYPNGGEVLGVGQPATLRWAASDDVSVTSVDLELSRDGGATFEPIVTGIPNDGSYLWTVTGPVSPACRLRVTAHDADAHEVSDLSNGNWTILDGPIVGSLAFDYAFGGDLLSGPNGIATSDDGFVYVADTYHSRVVKFTADGQLVWTLGDGDREPGRFTTPYGIDVDAAGFIYVSDFTRRDVQKFDSEAHYLATFAGPNELAEPLGLWVSDQGVVYVTDRQGNAIRRFTTDGVALPSWNIFAPQNIEGTNGAPGQPAFYVSDGGNWRVLALDANGGVVSSFNSQQNGNPTGAALLGPRLLLTEYNLNRAFILTTPGGSLLEALGDDEPYSLSSPLDAATLGDSLGFLLDTGNARVVRLRWTGSPPPEAVVTAPNGPESYMIGDHVPLTWQAIDDQVITNVDLWISHNEGQTWEAVAMGEPNDGTYDYVATGPPSSGCRFRVVAHDYGGLAGADLSDEPFDIIANSLSVDGVAPALELSAAPNPMRTGACEITYALPRATHVRLVVHDVQGREVARLADGPNAAGTHRVTWRGETGGGRSASGLYFIRLEVAGDRTLVRRQVVIH